MITIGQIQALEISSGQAGDLLQAAICQIVLADDVEDNTWEALSYDQQRDLINRFAVEQGGSDIWVEGGREWHAHGASEECVRVLGG